MGGETLPIHIPLDRAVLCAEDATVWQSARHRLPAPGEGCPVCGSVVWVPLNHYFSTVRAKRATYGAVNATCVR